MDKLNKIVEKIETIGDLKNIEENIKDLLKHKLYYSDENIHINDDVYSMVGTTIHADYRDYFSDGTIIEILSGKNPQEELNEKLDECYGESRSDMFDECIDTINEYLRSEDITDIDEEVLREWTYNNVYIDYDYDHFLQQKVKAILMIDTGDGNFDFGLNGEYGKLEEIDEKSSLLWLAKTQNYSKEQLYKSINDGDCFESKFLKSVVQEVEESTTCINALTFFIETTLEELINYNSKKEDVLSIEVDKSTSVGLVNVWNGSGSVLEIELEQNVKIPKEYIDCFTIDGNRGQYSVDSIYGLSNKFWQSNNDCKISFVNENK